MMPANAQNVATTASNEITTASATNSHTINFSDDAVDHSLSEVAKTFHWREFGNGAANAGDGATYADASMLDGSDDIAYVMDDGLTSLAGEDVKWGTAQNEFSPVAQDDFYYITFIGTGITLHDSYYGAGMIHLAQNLPYGTHVLKVNRGSAADPAYWVDGVSYGTVSNGSYGNFNEVTFHQPKKPPIPEDAVVLADYMLMADHVVQTDAEDTQISKGVRFCSGSRDTFVDVSGGSLLTNTIIAIGGLGGLKALDSPNSGGYTAKALLPFFGTNAQSHVSGQHGPWALKLGGEDVTEVKLDNSTTGSYGDVVAIADSEKNTLGQTDIHTIVPTAGYGWFGHSVVTPTHTSSHYQTFETPYLHELVGGDRNMEQTNLIVSPSGQTWDQVTRDMSYLGPRVALITQADTSGTHGSEMVNFFKHRGGSTAGHNANKIAKGIAWGFNRAIILEDGLYDVEFQTYSGAADVDVSLKYNDATTGGSRGSGQVVQLRIDPNDETAQTRARVYCKRGDFFCVATNTSIAKSATFLEIQKVE